MGASAPLAAGAGVAGQLEIACAWNLAGLNPIEPGQGCRISTDGLAHQQLPSRRPTIAVAEGADHTKGSGLMPGNALLTAPMGHSPVAAIGEVVACFLMAPELGNAALALQCLQHRQGVTGSDHQGLTEFCQCLTQFR